jgi:DNA-binding NtrC family response regulator
MAAARVLVVEDEQLYLTALGKMLNRAGYDVLRATGSRQALEIIKNEPPIDVVLSDVTMPGMPGTDLVREVALISPQTATMLMTGGVIGSAELPNGTTLLRKPFSMQDLLVAVQVALVRSTLVRDELASERQKSAESRQHSEQLRGESEAARREAAEARQKSQLLRATRHEY